MIDVVAFLVMLIMMIPMRDWYISCIYYLQVNTNNNNNKFHFVGTVVFVLF